LKLTPLFELLAVNLMVIVMPASSKQRGPSHA
jgi:hypothetical protein